MRPTKIQLGGITWTVRESSRPMKNRDGYCDAHKKEIVLSRGLSPERRREVFIHESKHAQFWFLEERVVETAAEELHEALDILDF